MINQVHNYKISQVFEIGNKVIYKIPKYQREYTWGINEWNQLFDDITNNDEGYFLGSYICVSTKTMGTPELELIDGQQRFTTISILLAAIYNKLNENREELDEDDISNLINLKKELTYSVEKGKYEPKLILQVQNSNFEDYMSLLSYNKIITEKRIKPNNAGNRRIYKAFKYFNKCLNEYIKENINENNNKIEILFNLAEKFNEAVIVGIEVDSRKDAYMLFESLNNRGIPLSAVDLIKNTLIAIAENKNKAEEVYKQWEIVLKYLKDDYAIQERFFRQYYNAFREELNKPFLKENPGKKYPLAYLATRTTLLAIYEKLIKYDFEKFLKELLEKSKVYSIIINNSDEDKIYKNKLLDLERIQGSPSYILLLYIIINQENLNLSEKMIYNLVDLLIKFFVRRNITDIPNTRNLNKIFMDIIDDIKNIKYESIYEHIYNKLKEVSASDELFESKLRGSLYDENPDATRFILCSIEEIHMTKEIYTNLWERDNNNKYIWTIEHIFPEGDNIRTDWVKMIANGNREEANILREKYVHTLGNLTITGYNSNLSDMPFEIKKTRKNKEQKSIGYENGLFLNNDVVCEEKWTIEKINERTEKIIKILMDMYKI